MRNASLHQHHFAPRIVGKGGILEAFGVGAVCCNWASLLDFHWTKSGKLRFFFRLKLLPIGSEALVPFLPLLVSQPSPPTAKSLEGVPTTCVLACVW